MRELAVLRWLVWLTLAVLVLELARAAVALTGDRPVASAGHWLPLIVLPYALETIRSALAKLTPAGATPQSGAHPNE
jgi:hypothetical protein